LSILKLTIKSLVVYVCSDLKPKLGLFKVLLTKRAKVYDLKISLSKI